MRRRSAPSALVGLALAAALTWSPSAATFTAQTGNPGSSFGTDGLTPPLNLLASTGGAVGTIDLSWTVSADSYASGYRVFRSGTPGGPFTQVAEATPWAATSYQDTALTPGSTYYYALRSYFESWESAYSNEASAAAGAEVSQARFPGTAVSEGLWEMVWSTPTNITADDNSDSTITNFDFDELVRRLRSSDYGFTIPANATIVGIEVQVEVHDDSTGGGVSVTDQEARLVKAGVPVGADKSKPGAWPSSRTLRTYGGPADLWGTTWTPAEVNAVDFGFGLRSGTSGLADNSKVDYHRIIVTYTTP